MLKSTNSTSPPQAQAQFNARVIIFDLDGTLVHSGPDLADAINRMLVELDMPLYADQTIFKWLGNGVEMLVERAITGGAGAEVEPELLARGYKMFTTFYRDRLCVRSVLYPLVEPVLDQLKTRGFKLACLTNKAETFTIPLLHTLRLYRYFDLVIAGDSLSTKKPDPRPIYHILREFDIPGEASVMVGDSVSDIQAAQAAGIPVICVSFGYNQGMDLTRAHPDAIIDSFAQLPELFEYV